MKGDKPFTYSMASDDRTEDEREPPGWHDVLGPTRTVLAVFWLQRICTVLGWGAILVAFFVWFTFESTRGRYISYARPPAERMGIEGAIVNPTGTAVLVLGLGVALLVGSVLFGGLRHRVRSHYVD